MLKFILWLNRWYHNYRFVKKSQWVSVRPEWIKNANNE